MSQEESLGLIETIGLSAAIAAADAAVKSANVTLIGYELTKGDGMTVVKLRGDVGAVKAAVSAAEAEAGRVGRVVATRVIARPASDLTRVVDTKDTVGVEHPASSKLEPKAPETVAMATEEEPSAEPVPTPEPAEQALSGQGGEAAETLVSPVSEPSEAEPAAPDAAPATAGAAEPVKQQQPPRSPSRPAKQHRRR
ncbi:BMC domain-containing protein [Rhizobium panacihumi]|uniref:BMC domain-containing protein n=1 Tax=Rhizobium panacihumi TaxID=2008450 RepID=UPI003D7B9EEF